MSDNRSLLTALLLGLIVLLAGDAILVWPIARAAGIARREIADYEPMLADFPVQTRIVESLANEVEAKRRRSDGASDPARAALAGDEILDELRRAASADTGDKATVRVRTSAGEVIPGSLSERDRAVTLDTVATFDSIFALIRRVELMGEPVRLVRVRIDGPGTDATHETHETRDALLLTASVDLEFDDDARREREID